MNLKLSPELLGLALLTLVTAALFKGVFLGWGERVWQLRQTVIAGRASGNDPKELQQTLKILKTKIQAATNLEAAMARKQPPVVVAGFPRFAHQLAGEARVLIRQLGQEKDSSWQITLAGDTQALLLYLHYLEERGGSLRIWEAEFQKADVVLLTLRGELKP